MPSGSRMYSSCDAPLSNLAFNSFRPLRFVRETVVCPGYSVHDECCKRSEPVNESDYDVPRSNSRLGVSRGTVTWQQSRNPDWRPRAGTQTTSTSKTKDDFMVIQTRAQLIIYSSSALCTVFVYVNSVSRWLV